MVFATQNPAGAYAGRKFMSRAFRSRFLELHVGDIPDSELSHILHERCAIAPSHADKLVSVMKELQRFRQVTHPHLATKPTILSLQIMRCSIP
jgi:midasin